MATVVVDIGASNTKCLLFDDDLTLLASPKIPSTHRSGPPYAHLDAAPVVEWVNEQLPLLDRLAPVDYIVPSAHGSGLALLDRNGELALPVMDYQAEPPVALRQAYEAVAPAFEEVYAPTNPMALTLGLQLYWQSRAFAEAFAKVHTIVPWGQYIAYLLCGEAVSEVTAFGAQTHLWDVSANRFSSFVTANALTERFAPIVPAWQTIGTLAPRFRGGMFQGRGHVLAGIHDSNANYLRFLASERDDFTLLSTGTWIIGFDTRTPLAQLDPLRDTVSNTDVFGRPVASCRFMGGREFELVSRQTQAVAANMESLQTIVNQRSVALPAFTDSGGPVPGCGGRGRLAGPAPKDAAEYASLASLYTALMTSEALDAVHSQSQIIVDGPFAQNPVFLGTLAALRYQQPVKFSLQEEGTAVGAALLARFDGDRMPTVPVELNESPTSNVSGLAEYAKQWRSLSNLAAK